MTPDDHALVESWRRDEFGRLGFSSDEIETLIAFDADLHEVMDLARRGCPQEKILRIVAPLDWPIELPLAVGFNARV
jgi:hypothetical protein